MEQKKIILLVEDNQQDEILTIRALKKNDIRHDIVVCRDGVDAIDWIFRIGSHASRDQSLVPNVVLLDLKLPKMDGQQVLAAIRQNSKTKYLPVVILTTSKEESDIARSYDNGANSFVQKPINFEDFTEVIKRLGIYWLLTNEVVPGHGRQGSVPQ